MFFIKLIIGSKKKYVKINGMIAIINGNIKLLNTSFGVKYVNMQSPLFIYINLIITLFNISSNENFVSKEEQTCLKIEVLVV